MMVSVLTSYTLDCEFDPYCVNSKIIKLIFAASSLRIQHQGATAKTRNQDNVPAWYDMSNLGI